MLIKNKWVAILLLISGLMVALSNAYLFLQQPALWQGIMIIVGLFWIWTGAVNLRRLQKNDPGDN